MKADGGDAQRISFGEGRYATPVWSPRGDWIAFTKSHEGVFHIGAMRTDGSGERLLSSGFLVEGADLGAQREGVDVLPQTRRGDDSGRGDRVRLFSIDLTGRNEREIVTGTDASDPAWSPPDFPELTASGGETDAATVLPPHRHARRRGSSVRNCANYACRETAAAGAPNPRKASQRTDFLARSAREAGTPRKLNFPARPCICSVPA